MGPGKKTAKPDLAAGCPHSCPGRAEDMDVIKRWMYDGINDQRADGDPAPRLYFDIGTVVGQFDGRQIRGETVCVYCVSEQRQQQRELLERFTGQMAEAGRPFVDFALRRRDPKAFGQALAYHIEFMDHIGSARLAAAAAFSL